MQYFSDTSFFPRILASSQTFRHPHLANSTKSSPSYLSLRSLTILTTVFFSSSPSTLTLVKASTCEYYSHHPHPCKHLTLISFDLATCQVSALEFTSANRQILPPPAIIFIPSTPHCCKSASCYLHQSTSYFLSHRLSTSSSHPSGSLISSVHSPSINTLIPTHSQSTIQTITSTHCFQLIVIAA